MRRCTPGLDPSAFIPSESRHRGGIRWGANGDALIVLRTSRIDITVLAEVTPVVEFNLIVDLDKSGSSISGATSSMTAVGMDMSLT